MKPLAVVLYLTLAVVIEGQRNPSRDFNSASDKCFNQQRVPQNYKATFRTFQYPNEEVVHKYVHCVVSELDIWNDRSGLDIEKIFHQYRGKANEELTVPILANCNHNTQNANKDLWSYRAFMCVLNTDVGRWFKEDVQRSQGSSLANGYH